MEIAAQCAQAIKTFELDRIMAVGGGSIENSARAAWSTSESPALKPTGYFSGASINRKMAAG